MPIMSSKLSCVFNFNFSYKIKVKKKNINFDWILFETTEDFLVLLS